MSNHSNKKSILTILTVIVFVLGGTFLITIFARGYKLSFNLKNTPSFSSTGIISATSKPKGASVYVNDKLVTATDDTLNLSPDEYTIKIVEDGYLPWEKKIQVKKEVVYQTNTNLFRSVSDLKPITLTGAINPTLSPDGDFVVYSVASASAAKDNGLYLLQLVDNSIPFSKGSSKLLLSNQSNIDWSKYTFTFSPDSKQVLAQNKTNSTAYLLNIDSIDTKSLYDVSLKLSLIEKDWQTQIQEIIKTKLAKLPKELTEFISTASAQDILFTSDDKKILYLTNKDGNLIKNIITPPPAQSTQTQNRDIKANSYYVYDIEDDTNFLIGSKDTIYQPKWLNNSYNLVFVEDQKIQTIEYDATNKQTLFAGNFDKNAVYPWLDGSKIVTLTVPYNEAKENLYAIYIK